MVKQQSVDGQANLQSTTNLTPAQEVLQAVWEAHVQSEFPPHGQAIRRKPDCNKDVLDLDRVLPRSGPCAQWPMPDRAAARTGRSGRQRCGTATALRRHAPRSINRACERFLAGPAVHPRRLGAEEWAPCRTSRRITGKARPG